jgi:hypothetical protein
VCSSDLGGGVVGLNRPDIPRELPWVPPSVGFAAIAPTTAPDAEIVFVRASGKMLRTSARAPEAEKAGKP